MFHHGTSFQACSTQYYPFINTIGLQSKLITILIKHRQVKNQYFESCCILQKYYSSVSCCYSKWMFWTIKSALRLPREISKWNYQTVDMTQYAGVHLCRHRYWLIPLTMSSSFYESRLRCTWHRTPDSMYSLQNPKQQNGRGVKYNSVLFLLLPSKNFLKFSSIAKFNYLCDCLFSLSVPYLVSTVFRKKKLCLFFVWANPEELYYLHPHK